MNDKFIGTTVSKKITVNILNPNNEINLENKEVEAYTGIIIDGTEESVPFGNFIIEKPDSEEVKEKTNFVGYDYMIKFNIPYKDRVTYPIKASALFEDVCLQAGVEAGNIDFVNCDYMILGNPFTNNENCRTVLSNIAQLSGGFAHIGRDNKVYIVTLKNVSNLLKVKDLNFMFVEKLHITPINMLSTTRDKVDENIDGNNYFEDFSKNTQWGEVNSLVLRISGTEGENNTCEDKDSIKKNGLTEIVIEDNYFLNSEAERQKVISQLWDKLKGIKYLPFKTKYYGYPYLDVGDMIYIADSKDTGHISYVMNHTFTFNGAYEGSLETPALTKTQTAYKNTADVKTKFKQTERVIDKINGVIKDIIQETSENSEKLTLHEQTIDSMKDTLKSQETKIETVESTVNTANATANSAKSIADSNSKKIETTTTKLTEVEKTVDGITQNVSSVEEKLETVESTANTAKSTADTAKETADNVNDNLTNNYYTKTETNSEIKQEADSITRSVNKKITEIQVDADNLLLNTALKKDASNFSLASGVTRVTDKVTPNGNYCFKYNISGLTADSWRSANPTTVDLNAEEIVTASANVYIPSGVTNSSIKIEIQFFKADNTRISTFTNAVDLTKTNTWQRVSVTGTAPANTVKANARVWIQRNGQCWVGDLKLGRGNTVTSWCPSSKDYPTTKEFGTLVEQNWEHVKVAWNTICEYLQMENLKGNASLVVRDENGKLIMSLDKTGQHYWTQKDNEDKNIAETTLKEITINNETKKALMFLLDNVEMNGEGIMAWGYKSGNNVYPVLYVGKFGDEEFGLHLATDLIAHANAIKFQNAQIDDDGANLYLRTLGALKVMDTENNTWIGQIFKDEGNYGFSIKADDFTILDSSGQTPSLSMYENEAGSKTLDLFENYVMAGNIANMNNLKYMSGSTWEASGDKYGMLYCTLRDGQEFTITSYSATSDERLKENIKSTKLDALERIKKINHIQFDWKNTKEHEEIGYIAQELEKIDKNYVFKIPNPKNDDMKYTVRELAILATTTKAVQELNEKVEKQEKIINKLLEKLNIKKEDLDA